MKRYLGFVGILGGLVLGGANLGFYVAKQFGVADRAESKIGRGSQARAYAKVVREAVESLSTPQGGK